MKDLSPKVVVDQAALLREEQAARTDLADAKLFTIQSDDDAKQFAADAQEVARQIKAVIEAEQSVTQPLEQAKKALKALFAPRRQLLSELDSYIRGELGRWTLFKAAEQRKQLAAAAEAANAGRTADLTEALGKVQEAAPAKFAGVSVKPVWTAVLVDGEKVPREWCVPAVKLIDEHAKKTPTDRNPIGIPGVEFVLSTASRIRG